MIYLDSAATTLQKPAGVGIAVQKAVRELGSPGRGGHKAAMRASEVMYRTREAVMELFNVGDPERVVFCMNATHALNIAIKSLARAGSRVVVSGYEHNSVVRPLYAIGAEVVIARGGLFDREGTIGAFERAITEGTELVVVNHTSNVFGFIQPVMEISEICRRRGVALIVDASQSGGIMQIDYEEMGAEYIAMPGHKGLYGPQGTGVLICRGEGIPLIEGGSGSNSRLKEMPEYLPDRLEAGTHNMPGIAGLNEGVRFVIQMGTERIRRHEEKLMRQAAEGLKGIGGVTVYYTEEEGRQSGVISFNIEGYDSERAAGELSARGIAVRAGLHCAPIAHESAGTGERGTVRASFSVYNNQNEVMELIRVVREVARKRR